MSSRSNARTKSEGWTNWPVEYLIPGRSWKVYVFPSSVGRGTATARSGTTVDPAGPSVLSKDTRPSLVSRRIAQLSGRYATAGSIESMPYWLSMVSVPPRWPGPAPVAVTHSDDPDAAADVGAFPTRIAVAFPDPGGMSDTVPLKRLVTQSPAAVDARPDGPSPTGTVWATEPVDGSMRVTVLSRVLATHTAFGVTSTALGPLPTK